jgi:hypothetical protein
MRITLANTDLQPVIDLLAGMPLKAAQSRARTKLLDLVRQANVRFGEDEYALVSEYAVLNDQGEPVFDDTGSFNLADPHKVAEFLEARNQLLTSRVEVEGPTYDGHAADILDLLDTYDQPLTGVAADAYAALYDAITTSKEQS